jgi:hypothetical protein
VLTLFEWKQSTTDLALRPPRELPTELALKMTPSPSQAVRD